MKKVVMSVAVAGLLTSLSAADLGNKDAAYLFGQNDANVVTMSSMEMAQTEGQVLGLLDPVLGLLGGDLLGGDLLGGDLLGGLLGGNLLDLGGVLDPVLGLVAGLPIVGPIVGGLVGGLPDNLLGAVPAVLDSLNPIVVKVQAGTLLDANVKGTVNSSLPTLVGGLL
jgi:hypothetical protein